MTGWEQEEPEAKDLDKDTQQDPKNEGSDTCVGLDQSGTVTNDGNGHTVGK